MPCAYNINPNNHEALSRRQIATGVSGSCSGFMGSSLFKKGTLGIGARFPDHIGERRQGPPSLGVGGWLCKEIAAKAWVMLLLVTA